MTMNEHYHAHVCYGLEHMWNSRAVKIKAIFFQGNKNCCVLMCNLSIE